MVNQLSLFTSEVTRVAREVGTEGILGGQADVKGVSGAWRDLIDSVNFMAGNLTAKVRSIAQVATAVARGDLTQNITVEAKGEVAALAGVINTMVDTLSAFADEASARSQRRQHRRRHLCGGHSSGTGRRHRVSGRSAAAGVRHSQKIYRGDSRHSP
ncbi:HAMP domain-containing protein [Nocardia gamkensis]|uniref:HAMP domain-containing protein n=1 Tax=Nocardia gamkensis TaxID=352869 RepID=UPI000AB2E4C3|nr:HAMP domain-containing protein [Nocardia gamkensis]NQE72172.1 Hybrid signal transduction histidine kinase J [Nocardia gamkensis]